MFRTRIGLKLCDMSTPHSESLVEEIQGLYGPFTFSEMLFQKIWAEGAFDQTQLMTGDGQIVRIRNAGRWNKLAGPDFMQARIRFDLRRGEIACGVVSAASWFRDAR